MTQRKMKFSAKIWKHYHSHGRHELPWRKTTSPYRIAVSEVMLQQTQASRVVPKYLAFIKQFPSARALASAPLKDVLIAWQGLGYNRRAKQLHEMAKVIVGERNGRFPATYETLLSLPGIGPYTAGAIMAFAYNLPHSIIETNIRTVYLHHFFHNKTHVTDKDILALVERTLSLENPREWYWALMDYGSYLKQTIGNNTHQSKHYIKQSRFKGSDREIRGAILKALGVRAHSVLELEKALESLDKNRIISQVEKLCVEGLVAKRGSRYTLPT